MKQGNWVPSLMERLIQPVLKNNDIDFYYPKYAAQIKKMIRENHEPFRKNLKLDIPN